MGWLRQKEKLKGLGRL